MLGDWCLVGHKGLMPTPQQYRTASRLGLLILQGRSREEGSTWQVDIMRRYAKGDSAWRVATGTLAEHGRGGKLACGGFRSIVHDLGRPNDLAVSLQRSFLRTVCRAYHYCIGTDGREHRWHYCSGRLIPGLVVHGLLDTPTECI